MFIDIIYSLTGKRIEPKGTYVSILARYSMLFGNKYEELRISLNDVANLADSILSRKEEYGNTN